MESFRVNSENENWYIGGVILIVIGILEFFIMVLLSFIYAEPKWGWFICFALMTIGCALEIIFGIRMCNDIKKRYTIFQQNIMEVHKNNEIRQYELSQVKEIRELYFSRGGRDLYVFTMEDGYQFHMVKDSRVTALFPNHEIKKEYAVKLEY